MRLDRAGVFSLFGFFRTPWTAVMVAINACSIALADANLIGLGPAPTTTRWQPTAISADGSTVVGYGFTSSNRGRAIRWTASDGAQPLSLPSNFWTDSYAHGVNADGTFVVGYGREASTDAALAWATPGGPTQFTDIPAGWTIGIDVSADGGVIAGHGLTSDGYRVFRRTGPNNVEILERLPGTVNASASKVSLDGSTIVGVSGTRAVRWTGSTLTDLGTLPGESGSNARGVNGNGSVVVGDSGSTSFNSRAFRWTASDGMTNLGTLPGLENAIALSTDAAGSAVVGNAFGSSPNGRAFLWTAESGMVDLNTLLPELGANLSGWTLTHAYAISADGRVITGYGVHNGIGEPWLATIPSSSSLVVLGVLLAPLRRRR